MACQERTKEAFAILIVEDDPAATDIISRTIGMQFPDAAIYRAENGVVGAELFRKHRPEVVITDIGMPLKDGVEMAREIKEVQADTRFIVLTAYSDSSFLEQFREIGAHSYLLKPLNLEKLMSAIQKCIDEIGAAAAKRQG